MPVYNGALFIKTSLSSIFSQITDEVEVIVVDDGSTDNTVELMHQYFQPYINSQQLVIHSEVNQGVSAARNIGIDHAQGEYIGFVDADDIVFPGYIETLLSALQHPCDIIEFGLKRFVESIDEAVNSAVVYTNDKFGTHAIASVIDRVHSIARWYPPTRIFRAHLFDGVRFPVGVRFCEDLMTIPKLYDQAKTITVLKEAIYAYRTNAESATFTVRPDYIENLITFYNTIQPSNLMRYKYLKMAVAYSIVSCQMKASGHWELPKHIQNDMVALRYTLPIYFNVDLRKITILCYPRLFKFLKRIKK